METKKVRIALESLAGKKIYREYFHYYFPSDSNYFRKQGSSEGVEGVMQIELLSAFFIDRKTKERWQKEKLPLYGMRKMDRHKIKAARCITKEEFEKKEKEKTLQPQ